MPETPILAGPQEPADEWDIDSLRLDQDFPSMVGGEKVYTTIPVMRPNPQMFVRFRDGEAWRLNVMLLALKERKETYLVHPKIAAALEGEARPFSIFLGCDRAHSPFLWAVRLPRASVGEPDNSWWTSARDCVTYCFQNWARIKSEQGIAGYTYIPAEAVETFTPPVWPANLSMRDIVKLAFQRFRIDDLDHPIVRGLRGA